MTEKHFSPALDGRRERDRLDEAVVEAAREYRGFVDLEIPSIVVCPACAPLAPGEFDAAKLRLHDALQALEEHDGKGEADASR